MIMEVDGARKKEKGYGEIDKIAKCCVVDRRRFTEATLVSKYFDSKNRVE